MNANLLRTPIASAILLVAATLLGLAAAALTRSDALPPDTWLNKPVLSLLHAVILGLWAAAWLGFWKHALKSRGGWPLAVGVALGAAVIAEVIQIWWPGHVCDALGMGCNLAGAVGAMAITFHHGATEREEEKGKC